MPGSWDFAGAIAAPFQQRQAFDQEEQLHPLRLAHTAALTRLTSAQAGEAEQRFRASQDFAKQMQGYQGEGKSATDVALDFAVKAMGAGATAEADKLLKLAETSQYHESQKALNEAKAAEQEVLKNQHELQIFTQTFGAVKTPEDLPLARMLYQMMGGKDLEHVDQLLAARGPAALEFIQRAGETTLQRQQQALKAAAEQRLELEAARRESDRAARRSIAERRLDSYIEHTNAARKTDGAKATSVTANDVNQATALIREKHKELWDDLATPSARQAAAATIAMRAAGLRRANPALSQEQAVNQAAVELEQEGLEDKPQGMMDFGKPGKQLKQGGASPPATAKPPATPPPPKPGDVVKGYRFKGGDPSQQASWEKVS